jgi:Ca2+-binding RTX toxin-like protein
MTVQKAGPRSAATAVAKHAPSQAPRAAQPNKQPAAPRKPEAKAHSNHHRDSFEGGKQTRSATSANTVKAAQNKGPKVSLDASGKTYVDLGGGDNRASVSQTKDGRLRVTSDGRSVTLTAEQSRHAIIRGGNGNDTVKVNSRVTLGVTIDGGRGNDALWGGKGQDTLLGGEGDDYVNGGKGNDSLSGGQGRDVLYGLDGVDSLSGGDGRDYLDGGKGNDALSGGSGADQLMGGRGNDTLAGESGKDVLAGGFGSDTLQGGIGRDSLFFQKEDSILDGKNDRKQAVAMNTAGRLGRSISISGDAEFRAQVQSDLDALRSLPAGQRMLRGLDGSGKHTRIAATQNGNTAEAPGATYNDVAVRTDGSRAPGANAKVSFNASRIHLGGGEDWMTRPPVVGLFHELAHAHDFTNGEFNVGKNAQGVPDAELAATGLPHGGPAPHRPTENDLRKELNLQRRPRY